MKKQIEKWKKKSLFSKITDVLFILLIVAFIIPASRTEVMAFVNKVKSKIITPRIKEEAIAKFSDRDYNWQLVDMQRNVHNFSEFEGKVVFVNFWATWCGPCIGEMPEIQELYNKYKDNEEIVFILATTDDFETIEAFAQKRDFDLPFYIIASTLPKVLEYTSIPTTFLINTKGEIMIRQVGAANWNSGKMTDFIEEMLK